MNTDRFKFRVWDKQDECYQEDNADVCKLCPDGKLDILFSVDDGYAGRLDTIPPDEYIIEQCTGQKDQSGKLVYEGDIVEQYSPMEDCNRRCVVVWENDAGGAYVCKYLDGKGSSGCFLASSEGTYFDGGYCRVVGNIHQNPEMVK